MRSNSLQSEFDDLETRRQEMSKTLDDLEKAEDSLKRLVSADRDKADQQSLEQARNSYSQLTELESQIQAALTKTELKERNLAQVNQALEQRHDLRDQVNSEKKTVDETKKKLDEVREGETTIRSRLEELRKDIRDAETKVTKADQAVNRQRRIVKAVQRDVQIRELQDRYDKANAAEKLQHSAQRDAAAILVTDEIIKNIRHAAGKLQRTTAALSAVATVVSFDFAPDRLSEITVNDDSLADGQTSVQTVETTVIAIPGYGLISIDPVVQDSDKLLSQQQEANRDLSNALEAGGVKSPEAAEEEYARRKDLLDKAVLAGQTAGLHAPVTEEHEAGAEALLNYIGSLKVTLEREMGELELEALPDRKIVDEAMREVQRVADEARDVLGPARAALDSPQEELGQIQKNLGAFSDRHEGGRQRLERLQTDLAEAAEKKSDEDLQAAIKTAEGDLAGQRKVVSELEAKRAGETVSQLDARISRLEQALRERQQKRGSLKEQIAGLQSRVEVLEGVGLDEAIQKKVREMELCQEQMAKYQREVQVLTLLLTALRSAESDAKERYLSPVLKRVRPYLQLLFPGADITIDENLHIVGVVREGGEEESFDHLSMGTQEQIAVLIRLAFAEMLVEQGHPATVILDDALVFSDDRRMERMFDILNMVANKVQIIVLTCREQLFEGVGGHHLSLQPGDAEALVSA